ncbi:MAG TPA: DUF721 domain-containing protein [Nitrospirota bacterium]
MAKKLDRFSATLFKILKGKGLESRLSEYRVFGLWEKAVGRVLAAHALPQSVRGKKLALIVDSPAWMQQISLLKPEIIEKLNKGLGREAIGDIALRLGEVTPSGRPPDDIPVPASLSENDRAKIRQYVQDIDDPDVKEMMIRVIEKDLLSKKAAPARKKKER